MKLKKWNKENNTTMFVKNEGGIKIISFIIAIAVLILGYFVYGGTAQKIFAPDNRISSIFQ